LRQLYPQFQASGSEIVAVSFESADLTAELADHLELPFPLLSNPGREAYAAYRLGRGRWLRVFSLSTIWAYARLLLGGRHYQHRRSDWRQIGGDFVIDGAGIVRYEHRGTTPADRPNPQDLLQVVWNIAAQE
jgi:peroxiredoxin